MGISSFMAGFLESATERIETKEKEAREVNRIRAERQLKDIMEGQKIEKKRKMEIRKNLRTISNTTGGEVLSQDQKVIIAADPDRFKRFLSFAQKDPSGMLIKQQVKDIQGGDFKNMTLGQKVELFAKQDVPEVSATIKETATAFGLPLDNLDASIKAGAASAGMTEEDFLAGVSRPTDKLPEFKEDLALDPSETLAQRQDRISVTLATERRKGKGADPEFIMDLRKQLTDIAAVTIPKKPTLEFIRGNVDKAIKNVEKIALSDKYTTRIPLPDGSVKMEFKGNMKDEDIKGVMKYYEDAIRPTLNRQLGITDPSQEGPILEDLTAGGNAFDAYHILFKTQTYKTPGLTPRQKVVGGIQGQGTANKFTDKLKSGKTPVITTYPTGKI